MATFQDCLPEPLPKSSLLFGFDVLPIRSPEGDKETELSVLLPLIHVVLCIDLWKVTNVHSNLFHHTGSSTSTLPLKTSGHFVFATARNSYIFIDMSSYIMPKKSLCNLVIHSVFSSIWGLGVFRISNTTGHVSDNFRLALFAFDNQSFLVK